ncbi:MAG: hypothetical protein Kow0022_17790 [Phycisphaerales bacterium]
MNTRHVRFPTLLIASLSFVVATAWYVVVYRRRDVLDQRAQELGAQQMEIERGRAVHVTSESVEHEIGLMNDEASDYMDRWDSSRDGSVVYRKLDEYAAETGVRVIRIEPSKSGVEVQRHGATVSVAGFIVEVQGTFASVLAYVERVQHQTGMTRIRAIRVYPAGSSDQNASVIAMIQTEHIVARGVFQTAGVTP